MLSDSLFTMAWRVITFRVGQTASRRRR